MSSRRITLLSLLVVFAVGLLAPVAALASGSSSAGDQQYVDPLGGGNGNGGSSGSGSSGSGSSGSGSSGSGSSSSGSSSSGSSSSGTVASSTGSTGSVSSSSSAAGASSGTTTSGRLPFTGFDVPIAVAIGIVLIGTGFLLRRRILRA